MASSDKTGNSTQPKNHSKDTTGKKTSDASDEPPRHDAPSQGNGGSSDVSPKTSVKGRKVSKKSPSPKNSQQPSNEPDSSAGHDTTSFQGINASSIKATSTPKAITQNVSDDEIAGEVIVTGTASRQARANSVVRDEDLQDELTPLLEGDGSEYHIALEEGLHRHLRASTPQRGFRAWFARTICSAPWCASFVFLTVVVILVLLLLVARNLPMLLDQAFVSEVQSVSIIGMNDYGISVHVIGATGVDYENVTSKLYGSVMKIVALFIGGVTVVPSGPSKVYLSGEGVRKAHVVDIFLPEISLDLIDHRVTDIDFISEAIFVQDSLEGVLQDLMKHDRSQPLQVTLEVEFASEVMAKWLHFDAGVINIREVAIVSPENMATPMTVEMIDLDLSNDCVALNATIVVDVLPMKLELEASQWNVSIADCHGKPAYLGLWNTSPFSIKPNKWSSIEVHGSIPKVPEYLLEKCEDGESPFNKFLSKLSNQNTLDIFVSAARTKQTAHSLPKWLYRILTQTKVNLNMPVDVSNVFLKGGLISNYTIRSLDLKVPRAISEDLMIEGNCELDALLYIPAIKGNFDLSLSNWTSSVNVKNGNSTVGSASTVQSSSLTLDSRKGNETSVLGVFDKWNYIITDHDYVGQWIDRLLNGQVSRYCPLIDADVAEVTVESSLLNTTLKDLSLHNISFADGSLEILISQSDGFLDNLLSSMNISIEDITLLNSDQNWMQLGVQVGLNNPLPMSLHLDEDAFVFSFFFEDILIGNCTFQSLHIPRTKDRFKVEGTILVDCTTFNMRNAAEKFASLILSGADNITVGAQGESANDSSVFGKLMKHIHVPMVHLPRLSFPNPEDGSKALQQELTRSSPFLLEATIHVFASEVELLVFNPVANEAIEVKILSCQAIYEGELLAYADNVETMKVEPGIYKTKRIPYKVGSGMGTDILRRALNGELVVTVKSDMLIKIDRFVGQVLLQIDGVTAKVRI
ncbi:hypothetical protein CJJ07_001915 [Candidozyma auris]|nr:hypothetical protein CJJ07_001915 [[Candida] auris]QEL61927.1 hypothetical protein CJJ09_004090 [[Candida] auris]